MKLREGFVSNSSSSSFIVTRYSFSDAIQGRGFKDIKSRLTKAQVRALVRYGFKPCRKSTPIALEFSKEDDRWASEIDRKSGRYGYSVICNQDCVTAFLVKHNIPFEAVCHYGHESVFYAGHGDLYFVPNRGISQSGSIEFGWRVHSRAIPGEGSRRVNAEEWLRNETRIIENDELE